MGALDEELVCGMEVPGGTTLDELPNLIGIGAENIGQGLRVITGSPNTLVKQMVESVTQTV
jgi:hypothetical protein